MESLIKAGAFDKFVDRSVLLNNIDSLLAYSNRLQKEQSSGQTDLFGNEIDSEVTRPSLALDTGGTVYTTREQLQWERELLGIYLSQHPLEQFLIILEEQTTPLIDLKPEHDGKSVSVGGIIVDFREITTKNGQKMGFAKIADQRGESELVLFPSVYQQTTGIWERDHVILVKGKVNGKDREGNAQTDLKILVDDAREITIEQATAYQTTGRKPKTPKQRKAKVEYKPSVETIVAKRLYLRLPNSEDSQTLMAIKQIIDGNSGGTEVVLVLGSEDQKQVIKLPPKINYTDDVAGNLSELVGAENVKLH